MLFVVICLPISANIFIFYFVCFFSFCRELWQIQKEFSVSIINAKWHEERNKCSIANKSKLMIYFNSSENYLDFATKIKNNPEVLKATRSSTTISIRVLEITNNICSKCILWLQRIDFLSYVYSISFFLLVKTLKLPPFQTFKSGGNPSVSSRCFKCSNWRSDALLSPSPSSCFLLCHN